MIEIKITDKQTGQAIYLSPLDGITVPLPSINENLQHQELSLSFKIAYDSDVMEFIIMHEKLNAVVYDGTTPIFTGFLHDDMNWIDNGRPLPVDNFTVTIYDNTSLLEIKTTDEISFIGKSLNVIVSKICQNCGINVINQDKLKDYIVPAFIIEPNKRYSEPLEDLLFQYGFTYYFNGYGEMDFLYLKDSSEPALTLDENDMLTGLEINRTSKSYTGVTVTYNNLVKKINEQVYFEGNGLDDDNKIIPIVVMPGQYWPYDSDPRIEASEGQVYQKFESGYAEAYSLYNGEKKYRRSSKTTLVYTENHHFNLDSWDSELTVDRTEFGSCKSSVRLLNKTDKELHIRELGIRADAYYRSDDIVINYGTTDRTYEYQALYIYDSSAASQFAAFLSRFFTGASFIINCRTSFGIPLGTKCKVDTGISGFTANALVISCEYDTRNKLYKTTLHTYGKTAVEGKKFKNYSSVSKNITEQQVMPKSISAIKCLYYRSASSTELIDGQWSESAPVWIPNTHIWSRTKILFGSGDVVLTEPIRVTALNNVSVQKVVVEYAETDNSVNIPENGWSEIAPAWQDGYFIWSRIVTYYTDGAKTISNSACITGSQGETGAAIKYLGRLSALPKKAQNGHFFLAAVDFGSETDLLLLDKSGLILSDGSTLGINQCFQKGYVYYYQSRMWHIVTDRNNFRYLLATNDLKTLNLPLSPKLQESLDEIEDISKEYTDSEISMLEKDIQKGVEALAEVSKIKDGSTHIRVAHYLGKLDSAPESAGEEDWYVDTQSKTLQWKRNGIWSPVTEYTPETAHLYNQAGFDLLDYAQESGAVGQWAAAFIGKLFTRDIVLKKTVGSIQTEGFDENSFYNESMTGMFRIRSGMGNKELYDFSSLQIDQVNTKYVSANDLNIVSTGGYNNARLEISGALSDTTDKYSYLLKMYPSKLQGYRDSQGDSSDVLWEMYTHTNNSLRLRTKYGFWVKKKDKNFFAETCGLGIASYSINESTMSGWIIFVNGVYVEWGEDISSSSISAINLSNAYNLVSYKVYLTAVGNVSTLPTVLNDNSHLKSLQSFYIKKPAGYPVFWLTIGTTNI